MPHRKSGGMLRAVSSFFGGSFEEPAPPSKFTIKLTSYRNYQATIRLCRIGQDVLLIRELANPYEPGAIIAVDHDDFELGYVPKDSWIRDALHEPAARCKARIATIGEEVRGLLSLTIEVQLAGECMRERLYADYR